MRREVAAIGLAVAVHAGVFLLSWPGSREFRALPVVVHPMEGASSSGPASVRPKTRPARSKAPAQERSQTRSQPTAGAPPQGKPGKPMGGTGGSVSLRDVLSWGNAAPVYPPQALDRGWEGRVELTIVWGPKGRAHRVEVTQSSGHPSLDEAARQAAKGWTAPPAFTQASLRVPVAFILSTE